MKIFEGAEHIHFVGIGGIGMSALARWCLSEGKKVSGTDTVASSLIDSLMKEGAQIEIGRDIVLPKHLDLLVYSDAVPLDDPQREMAVERSIPSLNYFQALGEATRGKRLIAIAGSHGKTTTVAMLALILQEAELDPTVVMGSTFSELGGKNFRSGNSDLVLVEACEYRRNFLYLEPNLLGIVNIDLDHLDYFKNDADYYLAFKQFAEQSEDVIWPEDILPYDGPLGVPGEHNRWNAGLATMMAELLGVSKDQIEKSLVKFHGAGRRMEFKGSLNGADFYDDYAHHPIEVKATLQAMRERFPDRNLIAVFQPHQYSRTTAFLEDFVFAFAQADEVIIPNIYESRDSESDKAQVSVDSLVAAISESHTKVKNGQGLSATADHLKKNVGEGDLVLVMGAGDVGHVVEMIDNLQFYNA
jgi:UDP-N-acetylmuramate--alanine ligase